MVENLEENRNCPCIENKPAENDNDKCDRDNKREKMLREIKALNFSVIELALYLDTHPDDQRALCLHRKYTNELKDLKDKFQKIYGPLTFYFPCNKCRWLEEPWPWERGNC